MKIYKNITLPAGIGWGGAAYKEGYEKGKEDQKEKLTTTSITENGTYTAEDGFSEVEVNVEGGGNLQPLNVTYMRNGRFEVTADPGYDGFQSPFVITVDVSGYTEEDLRNAYQSGWTDAMEECQRDWSKEYLTLEALETGMLQVNQPLDSSINKGEWVSHASGYALFLHAGDRVRFRGTALGQEAFSLNTLAFNVMGNAGSVIAGDDYEEVDNPGASGMTHMFSGCSGLTDASKLILPPKVAMECYSEMFSNCTSLVSTPELPATTLAERCYYSMFAGCTGLTATPELPATTLAFLCYYAMFYGCSSLTTAPELPATTLADSCYAAMFQDCISLTTTPELPATTLADSCYANMFQGCTSLTTAPELPVTTLTEGCYWYMFHGCTSLTTAPELPATTLTRECYRQMFDGCENLREAPDLPAPVLVRGCYYHMFDGCVRLAHIKCLATDISAIGCTEGWFEGHRPNGTFTKAAQMNDWSRDESGIPPAWTVRDAS